MNDKAHLAVCNFLGGSSIGVICGGVVGVLSYLQIPSLTLTAISFGIIILFGFGGLHYSWHSILGASTGTLMLNYTALWADIWLHVILGCGLFAATSYGCMYYFFTYNPKNDEDDLF